MAAMCAQSLSYAAAPKQHARRAHVRPSQIVTMNLGRTAASQQQLVASHSAAPRRNNKPTRHTHVVAATSAATVVPAVPAAATAAAAVAAAIAAAAAADASISWLPVALQQLTPAAGSLGVWAGLIAAGAFGLWSERFKLGKQLTGAMVATLAGMVLANCGFLPPQPAEVNVVFKYIVPLAIPMLLLSANMFKLLRESGPMLAAFSLGTATTLASSWAAMLVFPLKALGDEGWKIAAALTARHIGGAVNYLGVSESLGMSSSIFGAGLAADNLILTLYFIIIYSLANNIPSDDAAPQAAGTDKKQQSGKAGGGSRSSAAVAKGPSSSSSGGPGGAGGHTKSVSAGMLALALSGCICYLGTQLAALWGMPSQSITIITGITVTVATLLPKQLAPLIPSAERLALLLMQLFFAATGASADVPLVVSTAPVLFFYNFIAVAGHLLLLLGVGRMAGFSRKELLLASNANIGAPSTVAGMAAAKGWRTMLVPAVLTSSLGYAIGTFFGLGMGTTCLKPLCVP